jgi:hypothetical protein
LVRTLTRASATPGLERSSAQQRFEEVEVLAGGGGALRAAETRVELDAGVRQQLAVTGDECARRARRLCADRSPIYIIDVDVDIVRGATSCRASTP